MRSAHFFRIFSIFVLAALALGTTRCDDTGNGNNNGNTFALSVSITGIGSGSVTSSVGNIQCAKAGGTCSANINAGTAVTLTPTPDPGFFFNGFLGACKGIAPCTLTLNQAQSVQASFVNIPFSSNRDLDTTQNGPTNPSTENIWLVNSDGSHLQSLAGIVSTSGSINGGLPTFSPDGNQLVFLSDRNLDGSATPTANIGRNVWVVNADGSNLHHLAGLDANVGVLFNNPRWSPDGSRILFVSNRNINGTPTPNTNSENNIWMMNTDGSNPTALAGLDVASVSSEIPVWSPDGTKIAFRSTRNPDLSPTVNPSTRTNIWAMNGDGSGLIPLTKFNTNNIFADWPQWSPDGSQIVFESNRSLGPDPNGTPVTSVNLWKMGADGSNPVSLTQDTGTVTNRDPQWSPDGRFITFQSNQDPINPSPNGASISVNNIWSVAADGSQAAFPLTALKGAGIFCIGPYWSPDASLVVFDSNRDHNPSVDAAGPAKNLWVVKPDGNGALPLTDLLTGAFTNDALDLD